MKLRNVLIVVNDMDRAIKFYKEIFGLQVVLDQDGNVIMTEGLVLQDAEIWKNFLGTDLIPKNNMAELYFEERDIEGFIDLRKKTGIPFVAFNMDVATLEKYQHYTKPLTENDRTRLSRLADSEFAEVVKYMLEHGCKLEQEAVAL